MSAFSDAILCTAADLTQQESRMPEAAKNVRTPSGYTAFDGKYDLAKEAVEKWLRKHGIHPDGITNPAQLKRAAVYKTLELCYRDMGSKQDTVSWNKADYYAAQFDEEISTIDLDFDPTLVPVVQTPGGDRHQERSSLPGITHAENPRHFTPHRRWYALDPRVG